MATAKKTEAAAPAESSVPAKDSGDTMVLVSNPHRRFHFVQPSTGIRIAAGATVKLANDGWLALQVSSGVLKKA